MGEGETCGTHTESGARVEAEQRMGERENGRNKADGGRWPEGLNSKISVEKRSRIYLRAAITIIITRYLLSRYYVIHNPILITTLLFEYYNVNVAQACRVAIRNVLAFDEFYVWTTWAVSVRRATVSSSTKMRRFFDGVDFVRPLNDKIIVCICMMNNILKGFCKQLVMWCAVYRSLNIKTRNDSLFRLEKPTCSCCDALLVAHCSIAHCCVCIDVSPFFLLI